MEYESLHVKVRTHRRRGNFNLSKKIRTFVLSTPFLVLVGLALFLFNISTPDAQVSAETSQESEITIDNLLEGHNKVRVSYGLAPLKISQSLNTSAQRKALEMLETDCWSHYCPEGRSPWEFFKEAGYDYLLAGENLAEGFYNTEDVVVAWMNSRTHRENILKADYEEVGFGIVQGYFQGREDNVIIAVHFGTPSPNPVRDFISPITGDLTSPTLVEPRDGSFTNSESIQIKGTAPEASEVELILNGNTWATTAVTNGVFTYSAKLNSGAYELQVKSRIGTRTSAITAPSAFTIDRTSNKITLSEITLVENTDGNLRLNVLSENLFSLKISFTSPQASYNFLDTGNNLWTAQVPIENFENNENFTLETKDKAGNKWDGELPSSEVLFSAEKLRINQTFEETDSRPGRVISADVKAQVNIGALFMFISLFGIDFVTLTQTGLTKMRGKLQLHIGLIIIILMIALAGSLSGQILEGVSIT